MVTTFKFILEIPVTAAPPGYEDQILTKLQKEVRLQFGQNATVRLPKKKVKRKSSH